ncbi:uncharacterized protein LOC116426709 isoform X3 [Nomia melanderi]|uniref:uncharacterized protein LOC116426709 isoform X3 n=1 Tax=Nomia melanderi TaxID=2448451 RepID=UPI0013043E5C|nr:uncharacterized protein LOC116426709 isoform X3 [Nomia melanderi]
MEIYTGAFLCRKRGYWIHLQHFILHDMGAKLILLLFFSCFRYKFNFILKIFKQDAFNGNCPLWANSLSMLNIESKFDDTIDKISWNTIDADWWNYIVTNYDYKYKCKLYFISCFLSCIFGIIWSIMFLICGKGGHDIGIFEAPWRTVFPATVFNLIFVIITIYTTINLGKGYFIFSQNLKNVYTEISNTYKVPQLTSECEIVQVYLQQYNTYEIDVCKTFLWLQVLSYIQMWSWLAGLLILVFRIILINDFRILKIRIYDVSNDFVSNNTNRNENLQERNNKIDKEKME